MFFQRKPGKKAERVCVYYFQDGRQIAVPRKLTKHLDGKPDDMVEEWITWYSAVNAIEMRSKRREFGADIEALLKRFENYLKSRKRNSVTIRLHLDNIRLALPLFLEHDKDSWYLISGKLEEHLRSGNIEARRHNRINQSFRAFYIWLQQVNEIKHRHGLLLANRVLDEAKTPLRFTLTPKEVLDWAAKCTVVELKFIALAGFFFSLRTSEVFGARRQDFIAGKRAEVFEDFKVLDKVGLGCKLVINVQNCRRPNGVEYKPSKRKRGGVVACTNQEAAKTIVKLVNTIPEGLIISRFLPEHWAKTWRLHGIPGITIKDLRRASLYWLGHYTDIPFVGLKNHARHTDPETTALYVRRPEEAFDGNLDSLLDLEA